MMYSQDYDEKLFGARLPLDGWTGALMPYVKNNQIFTCPSWSGTAGEIPRGTACKGCGNWVDVWSGGYTYANQGPAATANTPNAGGCINWASAVAMGSYDEPAAQWLAYDGTCPHGTPVAATVDNMHVDLTRHNGGSNVVFMDGHSKWMNKWPS
jgi:prepilin-type processing-associated H-X9-DG protein